MGSARFAAILASRAEQELTIVSTRVCSGAHLGFPIFSQPHCRMTPPVTITSEWGVGGGDVALLLSTQLPEIKVLFMISH